MCCKSQVQGLDRKCIKSIQRQNKKFERLSDTSGTTDQDNFKMFFLKNVFHLIIYELNIGYLNYTQLYFSKMYFYNL